MKTFISACIYVIFVLAITTVTFADTKEITSTGKFVMGDLDSKSDAKKIAIMNAKQMALEEAGTYLSSISEVKNFELTRDEISSLAAGILSVKVIDEKWRMEGESPVIIVVISALVNTDGLEDRIYNLKNNDELVNDFNEMQSELESLRKELTMLKDQTAASEQTEQISTEKKNELVQAEKETISKIIALEEIKDARWNMEEGNPKQAIAGLSRTISQNSGNLVAYVNRSRAYLKLGRNQKALQDVDTALKISPDNVKALEIKGQILLKSKQPNMAIASFSRAIQLKPGCGTCYFGRGVSFMQLKKVRMAGKDFIRACKLQVRRGCEEVRKLEARSREYQQGNKQQGGRRPLKGGRPRR